VTSNKKIDIDPAGPALVRTLGLGLNLKKPKNLKTLKT